MPENSFRVFFIKHGRKVMTLIGHNTNTNDSKTLSKDSLNTK